MMLAGQIDGRHGKNKALLGGLSPRKGSKWSFGDTTNHTMGSFDFFWACRNGWLVVWGDREQQKAPRSFGI
jgi:hypothetical protein